MASAPALQASAMPSSTMPSRGAVMAQASGLALASSVSVPVQKPLEAPQAEPVVRLRRFEDVVALAGERRDIMLKTALERDVRLVRFEDGQIEFSLADGGSRTLANDLTKALSAWTNRRWIVALSSDPGAPTLREQKETAERELRAGIEAHPLVQTVLSRFPGAKIVGVHERVETAAASDDLPTPPDGDGADWDGE